MPEVSIYSCWFRVHAGNIHHGKVRYGTMAIVSHLCTVKEHAQGIAQVVNNTTHLDVPDDLPWPTHAR